MSLLAAGRSTCSLCSRGKGSESPMKANSTLPPSRPRVLLLTHPGMRARLPSRIFGKGRCSRVFWGSLAKLQRQGKCDGRGQEGLGTTGHSLRAEGLVLVPVKGPCGNVFGGGRQDSRPEEQKQAQAGVNELCWTQLQLDNLYDSFQL